MKTSNTSLNTTHGGLAASVVGLLFCARVHHTRHRTPRSGFVSKVAANMVSEEALLPRNQSSSQTDIADRLRLVASPLHKTTVDKPGDQGSRLHRQSMLYRTRRAQPCQAPRRDPLQAKSSHVVVATSVAVTTQSHTALDDEKQLQPSWSAASG
jgi:hypothetical protein